MTTPKPASAPPAAAPDTLQAIVADIREGADNAAPWHRAGINEWAGRIEALAASAQVREVEAPAWIATNGVEPDDWEKTTHIWLCWTGGSRELSEARGSIEWAETTHWMPVNIEVPSKP